MIIFHTNAGGHGQCIRDTVINQGHLTYKLKFEIWKNVEIQKYRITTEAKPEP